MFDLPSDPMEIVVSAPSGRLGPERWNGDNLEVWPARRQLPLNV
jgi:hypothetical protein